MKPPKTLLTVDELIEHMKSKGIRFDIVSEDEAREFLADRNYYMKLSAYRSNYPKCPKDSIRSGQYQNLDFAYLQELSTIDMHLRYHILQMCLDIEHALKVRLVTAVTNDGANGDEDGYRFVKDYFKLKDTKMELLRSIRTHKAGEYCKDLIEKYYPYFPIWVLVELVSFGELIQLCSFYDSTRSPAQPILIDGKFLNIIRDFRNASAHSNCLLNKAAAGMDSTKQCDIEIANFIKAIPAISKESRSKYLHSNFCYNMVVLFYVYSVYMPSNVQRKRFQELKDFMEGRVSRNKSYFTSNPKLCGVYSFLKKVIDNLAARG